MFGWEKVFKRKNKLSVALAEDKQRLLQEIRIAHMEWAAAQERLDWVIDDLDVDYAVYSLTAAEKRYGILLKEAKALKWNSGDRLRDVNEG